MRRNRLSSTAAARTKRSCPSRRGAITVLSAVLMIVMLGMLAFAVDIGYMCMVQTESRRAADAGALAGASALVDGALEARQSVEQYVALNHVGGRSITGKGVVVETGHWDPDRRQFSRSNDLPSAIRVLLTNRDQPLFFSGIFGHDRFDTQVEAIAVYQPRDIMIVLDYSASMTDDSELRSIRQPGMSQTSIEANLWQIYNELGSPTFGKMTWKPRYISSAKTATVKKTLGLTKARYPYPRGSWDEYINYVKTSSVLVRAGYHKRYGYLTWVNYLLEARPGSSETPVLWMTSEQPITAVKDAVELFLAYLQEHETEDRVGLAVYTAADGTAKLETGLSLDYRSVGDISRRRQGGHYHSMTNIGAGIRTAREELAANARLGAFKLMVLMTDGLANLPRGTNPTKYAMAEAQLAADLKIPIVTISLGSGADTSVMQQIADLSGGVHFNIPGGQGVAQYEQQLREVFHQIAKDRPLKLVK